MKQNEHLRGRPHMLLFAHGLFASGKTGENSGSLSEQSPSSCSAAG